MELKGDEPIKEFAVVNGSFLFTESGIVVSELKLTSKQILSNDWITYD